MTQAHPNDALRPWYREPWPWIIIGLLSSAVLASLFSAWLAVKHADGLVVDDYYKQGLAINHTLALDERAQALGLSGELRLEGGGAQLVLSSHAPDALPKRLRLRITHPTREGLDQTVDMEPAADGSYRGILNPVANGHWKFLLEDDARTWRLLRVAQVPNKDTIRLVPELDPRYKAVDD